MTGTPPKRTGRRFDFRRAVLMVRPELASQLLGDPEPTLFNRDPLPKGFRNDDHAPVPQRRRVDGRAK